MLKALKKRAVVCNIGHFDNEIDTAFMRANWGWEEVKPQVHKIHRTGKSVDPTNDDYLILLAEGRLVNLGNATGHPSRIMDGSFANQVLAQIHLYNEKFADLPVAEKTQNVTVMVLPKKLDEEVALEMVKGFGGVVTQLTAKQAEYIGVAVEGPFAGQLPLLSRSRHRLRGARCARACGLQLKEFLYDLFKSPFHQLRVLPHQDRSRA